MRYDGVTKDVLDVCSLCTHALPNEACVIGRHTLILRVFLHDGALTGEDQPAKDFAAASPAARGVGRMSRSNCDVQLYLP